MNTVTETGEELTPSLPTHRPTLPCPAWASLLHLDGELPSQSHALHVHCLSDQVGGETREL